MREALRNKHPEARDVELSDILEFPECPEFQDIIVDSDVAESVAKKLSGFHGPTGVDATTLAA